jgi:hypothetical protein
MITPATASVRRSGITSFTRPGNKPIFRAKKTGG